LLLTLEQLAYATPIFQGALFFLEINKNTPADIIDVRAI
jgi:hypothetical protein